MRGAKGVVVRPAVKGTDGGEITDYKWEVSLVIDEDGVITVQAICEEDSYEKAKAYGSKLAEVLQVEFTCEFGEDAVTKPKPTIKRVLFELADTKQFFGYFGGFEHCMFLVVEENGVERKEIITYASDDPKELDYGCNRLGAVLGLPVEYGK